MRNFGIIDSFIRYEIHSYMRLRRMNSSSDANNILNMCNMQVEYSLACYMVVDLAT